MGYDLILKPIADAPFAWAQIEAFFLDRPGYTITASDTEREIAYQNLNTDVYFSFDWTEPSEAGGGHLAFRINYLRPHTFALEAAPELEACIIALDAGTHDPQTDGMGEGPFSQDEFVRGWNAGNRFACEARLGIGPFEPATAPSAAIEEAWRWNEAVDRNEAQMMALLEDVFVPVVHWMIVDGADGVQRTIFWGNHVRIALPQCTDYVVLGVSGEGGAPEIFGALPAALVRERVTRCTVDGASGPLEVLQSSVGDPPADVLALYEEARRNGAQIGARTPADRVLDAEALAQARAALSSVQGESQ